MATKNQDQRRTGNQSNSAMASGNSQGSQLQTEDFQALANQLCSAVENYSRSHPAAVGTAIFFLGFYVGWKVKPW